MRGPNVFKEYYKMEAKTKSTVDADGWLHSGDIGVWTEAGKLRIVDRKKNIFKLAQGEYIAAERIEEVLEEALGIKATLNSEGKAPPQSSRMSASSGS